MLLGFLMVGKEGFFLKLYFLQFSISYFTVAFKWIFGEKYIKLLVLFV